MRMDTRAALSARNLVNEAPEEEIANILWQFGEERASRAIARAMVKARAQAPITTTAQLARIVESVLPRKGRQHPGTRTFQALRIAVNGELDALGALLDSSVRLLGQGDAWPSSPSTAWKTAGSSSSSTSGAVRK